ncbi:hypothetical protein FRC11_010977 [Ceratobasidium sp. 423]|nr:hypothetical protein FRC11_010977 [Ceratobasidium sp. 423]
MVITQITTSIQDKPVIRDHPGRRNASPRLVVTSEVALPPYFPSLVMSDLLAGTPGYVTPEVAEVFLTKVIARIPPGSLETAIPKQRYRCRFEVSATRKSRRAPGNRELWLIAPASSAVWMGRTEDTDQRAQTQTAQTRHH